MLAARALGLAGCGGGDDEGGDGVAIDREAAQLKVGLITDLGQLDDEGFNELAYRGLKRAERSSA